jgi:N-acetylmuramoyl-L-alanine amidase
MLVLRRLIPLCLLLLPVSAWAKPAVTDARIGADGDLTRIELQVDQTPHFHVFYVPDPDRIVIDLDEVDWRVAAGHKLQGTALVAALRYGLFKAGTSRIVLDLQQPAVVANIGMEAAGSGTSSGRRALVIDLHASSAANFKVAVRTGLPQSATSTTGSPPTPAGTDTAQESSGQNAPSADAGKEAVISPAKGGQATTQQANKTTSGKASVSGANQVQASQTQPTQTQASAAGTKAPKAKVAPPLKPMVVIDAGHGGIDPGAMGNGVMEKNITLAVALALKKELLATGHYRVTLTRDTDVYIPLRDRFKVARDNGADLFISLHADSHNDPFMRGASIYTLSETASDAEAADLANQENKSDIIAGVDLSKQNGMVTDILINLAQRDTINQSNTFAGLLVSELKSDTLMLEHSHRSAGFAVLKAPDVPSVLIEMGYISSDQDEQLLSNKQHQQRLAKAIRRAVDDFFSGRQPTQGS